jgi:hypothetical protein
MSQSQTSRPVPSPRVLSGTSVPLPPISDLALRSLARVLSAIAEAKAQEEARRPHAA